MSCRLFSSPADAARGNSRESFEAAIAFCFLINCYLSFHLSCFHQCLETEPRELLPTYEPLSLSQPEAIWQHPSFWFWGQVQCTWSDAKGGHGFCKLSDQENLTHPHGLERTMPNSTRWFQATWDAGHVGKGKRELHPLSAPGFSSYLGSSRMLR